MKDLEPVLQAHPFLTGLSDDHIRFMVGCAQNLRFRPGEILFREGNPPQDLLLIRSGEVSLECDVPGRKTEAVETVFEGDILGWSSLFVDYRWYLSGRAKTLVRVIAFDGPCLKNKMSEDPSLGFEVVKRLLYSVHQRLERVRLRQLDVYRSLHE